VRVARPADPVVATWNGGAELAKDMDRMVNMSVTKAQYEEHGSSWIARKFGGR
jgi:actin-related protein 6